MLGQRLDGEILEVSSHLGDSAGAALYGVNWKEKGL